MKIIIITEGSSEIGFGHITRCTSLYQAFKEKNFQVHFIVNGDSTIASLLKDTEHSIFNWLGDSPKLLKLLNGEDIVVLDSYLADEELYKTISDSVALSVYIDDNKRINYPKGIVINGSIFASKINYPAADEVDYLLGSQYVPLRREFWNFSKKEINKNLQDVMITFGGDDFRDMTPDILKILIDKYPHFNKKVVIGRGFKKISVIENLMDEKTELIYYPDSEGMLKLMLESDMAISAGGQTLYELAKVGLPTIAIGVAYNQTHNLENWQEAGFIEFVGFWDNENLHNNILEKLDLLKDKKTRLHKCINGKNAVDGKGANRIVKYSLNKYYDEKISLRPVKTQDIKNIYNLSNEDEVRQNSFNTDKIKFEDHEIWFKTKIADSNNLFLAVEIQNNFAAQVRFDLEGDNVIVSISINKKYRGLGLGTNILKKSIKYLKTFNPSVKTLKACIKESNKTSIKFFENFGFIFEKKIFIKNQYALEYIYKL